MTSKIYSDPEIMKIKQELEINREIDRWYLYRSTTSYDMAIIQYSTGVVMLAIGLLMELLIGFLVGLLVSAAIASIFFFLGNHSCKRSKKLQKEHAEWKAEHEKA